MANDQRRDTRSERGILIVLVGMVTGLSVWGAVASWLHWYFWPIAIVGAAATAIMTLAGASVAKRDNGDE